MFMDPFDKFDRLIYGFSERTHGNMSPLRGDSKVARENRINFLSEFDISPEKTVKCRLSHSTNIKIVTGEQGGAGILPGTVPLPDTDGLITEKSGLFLFMVTADCVPILLFEPERGVVALLHGGWKGTLNGIAQKGTRIMKEKFNCSAKKIYALFGPSICLNCYEIGDEVKAQFNEKFPTHSNSIFRKVGRKFHLDLWKANFLQLTDLSVLPENIGFEGTCTKCNQEKYFSARGEGIETGRFASVIGIR